MGAALHLNVSGYPGDKCSGNCQYLDSDPVASLQATAIFYRADTMPGDSGSSVYTLVGGTRYVVAAHRGMCSGNSSANCGARITSDRYNQIVSWINSGF